MSKTVPITSCDVPNRYEHAAAAATTASTAKARNSSSTSGGLRVAGVRTDGYQFERAKRAHFWCRMHATWNVGAVFSLPRSGEVVACGNARCQPGSGPRFVAAFTHSLPARDLFMRPYGVVSFGSLRIGAPASMDPSDLSIKEAAEPTSQLHTTAAKTGVNIGRRSGTRLRAV